MREQLLVNYIRNTLRALHMRGLCRYVRNNTGARPWSKRRAGGGEYRGFLRFGEPGSPDFFVFLPRGRTLHVEVKAADGRLRDVQCAWRDDMARLGHAYTVVRSREEWDELITSAVTSAATSAADGGHA